MSVQMDRGAWLVRWRNGSGRQRSKRFSSEEAAQAFDSALSEITPGERQADATGRAGGVYPYATKQGTRWYFKVRDSNGIQTSRRGFSSEQIDGVIVDARQLPAELQAEARRRGLIPDLSLTEAA